LTSQNPVIFIVIYVVHERIRDFLKIAEHTFILLRGQGPGAIMSQRSVEVISDHCA